MAEVNIRYVTDERDSIYYPITHMDAIEGFDMSAFEDITEIRDVADTALGEVSNVSDEISSLRSSISSLQNAVANIASVTDTGWQNLTLLNNTVEYNNNSTPKARLVTVNGIKFLSITGNLKGLTSNNMELARIPANMTYAITNEKFYTQNMSVSGGTAQFTRMKIDTAGVIKIERATLSNITDSQWFALDVTFML